MTIRPLRRTERDDVLGIARETGMFTPEEIRVAEELIEITLNRPGQKDYRVVVMENPEQALIGFLIYGPTPLAEGTYDLYWMGVRPGEQRKGYGRELMRWLEEEILRAGGRMILIETSSQEKYAPTREFYTKSGYREEARIPDFYKPGDDRIIYVKHL